MVLLDRLKDTISNKSFVATTKGNTNSASSYSVYIPSCDTADQKKVSPALLANKKMTLTTDPYYRCVISSATQQSVARLVIEKKERGVRPLGSKNDSSKTPAEMKKRPLCCRRGKPRIKKARLSTDPSNESSAATTGKNTVDTSSSGTTGQRVSIHVPTKKTASTDTYKPMADKKKRSRTPSKNNFSRKPDEVKVRPKRERSAAKSTKSTVDTAETLTEIYDPYAFTIIWPRLRSEGWTFDCGSGLNNWTYYSVGVNRKTAILGESAFGSEEDVIHYCKQKDGYESSSTSYLAPRKRRRTAPERFTAESASEALSSKTPKLEKKPIHKKEKPVMASTDKKPKRGTSETIPKALKTEYVRASSKPKLKTIAGCKHRDRACHTHGYACKVCCPDCLSGGSAAVPPPAAAPTSQPPLLPPTSRPRREKRPSSTNDQGPVPRLVTQPKRETAQRNKAAAQRIKVAAQRNKPVTAVAAPEWWRVTPVPTNQFVWPYLNKLGFRKTETVSGTNYFLPESEVDADGISVFFKSSLGLRLFFLRFGIPHASRLKTFEKCLVERWARFANVPAGRDLASVKLPNHSELWDIIFKTLPFERRGGKIFLPPSPDFLPASSDSVSEKGVPFFDEADLETKVREFVCQALERELLPNDNDEYSRASLHPTTESYFRLRLWGATSPNPLPVYKQLPPPCVMKTTVRALQALLVAK
jgi:hypothetical protein